jgi:hypothetical protein
MTHQPTPNNRSRATPRHGHRHRSHRSPPGHPSHYTPGLPREQKVTATRARLTRKSPTYRALTADPFAVLAPTDPELPF